MKKLLLFLLFFVIAKNGFGQTYINVWGDRGTTNQTRISSLPESFASLDPTGNSTIIYERFKSPDFIVTTSDGKKSKQNVIQYRSIGDFSVLTKTDQGWIGYLQNETGNWNLTENGVVKDDLENLKNVGEVDEIEVPNTLNKTSVQTNQAPPDFYDKSQTINKICKVYIEVCNDLYVRWGSNTSNTISQVGTIFGSVKELYARDGVQVQLGEVFIWTTVDPYANLVGSLDILSTFGNNRINVSWRFKHLLNNKNYGGIAYVSTDALTSVAFAYSGIGGYAVSSSSIVYSWPLYVFSHEMGHNLGSRHTHWGCWIDKRNNALIGRLDSCYSCEPCGSTAPNCNTVTKLNRNGTIMSYCHINGNINPSRGFGLHPGATIRRAIWNSDIPFETGSGSCTTTYSAWSSCSNGLQTRTYTQTGTSCIAPPSDSLSRACNNKLTDFIYVTNPSTWYQTFPPSKAFDGISTTNDSRWLVNGKCSVKILLNKDTLQRIRILSGYLGGTDWSSLVNSLQIKVNGVLTTISNTNVDYTFTANNNSVDSIVIFFNDLAFNRIREIELYGSRRTIKPCTTTYSTWSTCSNSIQTRTYTQTGNNCVTPPADSLTRSCTISQAFQITNQICYRGTDGKWRVKFNITLNPTSYPTIGFNLCRYGTGTGNCNGANLTPSACGIRNFTPLTLSEKTTGFVDRIIDPIPASLNSCYRLQITYGTNLIWTPFFIYN
jgi:hypothetical protein